MRRLVALVALAFLVTAAAIAETTQASNPKNEIIALERAFDQANAKNDAAILDKLTADDYAVTYLVPPKLETKAQMLASTKGPQPLTVTASAIDNLNVRVHGDTAIVTATWKQTRTMTSGTTVTMSGRLTDVWLKLAGQWKLEASHASPDGPPKS